jgi:translation initiation factor IF-3
LSRPFSPRSSASAGSFVRVNGKIRAREVRVISVDGKQLGVLSLQDAINAARANGVDLVEVAPNATPPVCRLVDFGKYRYEQAKKDKEAKKHQHSTKVKEVQLSPSIDPHDFGVKLHHAMEFLCEEMKVKITLRFRGRELAHPEFGFQVVEKFIKELGAYGHPDAPPKKIGKGINVMISPLPRNKRAKSPRPLEAAPIVGSPKSDGERERSSNNEAKPKKLPAHDSDLSGEDQTSGFGNNPFSQLDIKVGQ